MRTGFAHPTGRPQRASMPNVLVTPCQSGALADSLHENVKLRKAMTRVVLEEPSLQGAVEQLIAGCVASVALSSTGSRRSARDGFETAAARGRGLTPRTKEPATAVPAAGES
jgi:hypothetical protein